MKLRQSLVLLLVLGLLIGLYAGMRQLGKHRVEQAQLSSQVFSFKPADIKRLSITRLSAPTATAERISETEWRILEPNPTVIPFNLMWNRVAEHVAALTNDHTVLESPSDVTQYGLDAPSLTIEVVLTGHQTFHLCFGLLEPTQRCRYARLDQGPLFLVNTNTFFELDRSLYDLRHRYLVDERDIPIQRMELAWIWTGPPKEEEGRRVETGQESITLSLERADQEAPWRIIAPFEALARYEKAQELATALQFAVCREFIDSPENLADYGLAPARARITFQDLRGGPKKTIWLGMAQDSAENPGLFVKTKEQESVLVIEEPLLNLLPTSPTEWRDLRLLTGRISDIKELIYTRGGERFILEKDAGGDWRLAEPVLEATNTFAVNAFLNLIKEVEGDAFVEDSRAGAALKNPEIKMALRFDNDTTSEILLAPNPKKPGACYARQDSGGIVSLSGVAVDMLHINGDTFRSLELVRFSPADVREFTLRFEDKEYTIARRQDLWIAVAPKDFQIMNQSDIAMLFDAISPLKASGLADDTDDSAQTAPYGLETPVFTITLSTETADAQEPPLILNIGAVDEENPGERYARSSMRTGIYKIKQEVMDKIREALRGFQ